MRLSKVPYRQNAGVDSTESGTENAAQHIQLVSLSIRPESVGSPYVGSSRRENVEKVSLYKNLILNLNSTNKICRSERTLTNRRIVLACESHLLHLQGFCEPAFKPLMAWNWSWWEYLHQWKWGACSSQGLLMPLPAPASALIARLPTHPQVSAVKCLRTIPQVK